MSETPIDYLFKTPRTISSLEALLSRASAPMPPGYKVFVTIGDDKIEMLAFAQDGEFFLFEGRDKNRNRVCLIATASHFSIKLSYEDETSHESYIT